jgi:hypothetical protein
MVMKKLMNCTICGNIINSFKIFDQLPISSAHLSDSPITDNLNYSFNAGYCDKCFHISNIDHGLTDIVDTYTDSRYITKKAVSSQMSKNLEIIRDFILSNLDIKSKELLEIGSGSGELAKYFSLNGAIVTTIDPCIQSYDETEIEHHQEFFDSTFVDKNNKLYDIIIARHIVEHTENPIEFLKLCDKITNIDSLIYIEVPNLENTLDAQRIIDFFNDHVQHFSITSMVNASIASGFRVVETLSILNKAHLGFVLKKQRSIESLLSKSIEKHKLLIQEIDKCNNFSIYGAGAHAVTFLSQLDYKNINKIKNIFDNDINKNKKYLLNSTTEITIPTEDNINNSEIIINTAALYVNEIELMLRKKLNFTGKILHL